MWRDFTMSSRRESSNTGSYQTKSTSEFHKNSVPQLLHPQQQQSQQQQQQIIINGQQRSSYSLPHPAHMQSNTRWQHLQHDQHQNAMLQQQQPLHRSTLMHSPSYPHIPSAGDPHLLLPLHSNGEHRGGGGRPRPVSMYDTPPSSGGGGFSFIPSLLMPNRSKGNSAAAGPQIGYNASAPASLQHQFHAKHQQQQQQQPKKGQIMRQGPGELVRDVDEDVLGATPLSLTE